MTRIEALEAAFEALQVQQEAASDQMRDSEPGTPEHTEAAAELGQTEEAIRVIRAWYAELAGG